LIILPLSGALAGPCGSGDDPLDQQNGSPNQRLRIASMRGTYIRELSSIKSIMLTTRIGLAQVEKLGISNAN
jgi:hypothetical protein